MSMCEKLFNHVGQFRDHCTEYVKDFVDDLLKEKIEDIKHDMIDDDQLTEQQRIFMDEDDRSLYFASRSKKHLMNEKSERGKSLFYKRHHINIKDNIMFKFTTKDSLVHTISEDGKTCRYIEKWKLFGR